MKTCCATLVSHGHWWNTIQEETMIQQIQPNAHVPQIVVAEYVRRSSEM
jgi:hypothetical protein